MKLFYKAGACSLASHIVMAELNMVYELESVDLRSKTFSSGNYLSINPNGSVPAIHMENGEILTEGVVIMQYLADLKPEGRLIPQAGTIQRYRCLEWLNFIATDLHKNYSPLFYAAMILKSADSLTELKSYYQNILKNKLTIVSNRLGSQTYLFGDEFTIADAYLFTVLGWSQYVGVELSDFSNITAYMKRVGDRPGVMRAMREEGLI